MKLLEYLRYGIRRTRINPGGGEGRGRVKEYYNLSVNIFFEKIYVCLPQNGRGNVCDSAYL